MLKKEFIEILEKMDGCEYVLESLEIRDEQNKIIGSLIYDILIHFIKNPMKYIPELLKEVIKLKESELMENFTKRELQKLLFAIQIAVKYVFEVDVKTKEYKKFKNEPIPIEDKNEIN